MVLNLFPLPPLDGGRIAVSLLPHRIAYRFARIEPFGMIILLVLMFLGVLNVVMLPFVNAFITSLASLFSI
jgi:Zn-dependent protease